jgi:hypothetical protein
MVVLFLLVLLVELILLRFPLCVGQIFIGIVDSVTGRPSFHHGHEYMIFGETCTETSMENQISYLQV